MLNTKEYYFVLSPPIMLLPICHLYVRYGCRTHYPYISARVISILSLCHIGIIFSSQTTVTAAGLFTGLIFIVIFRDNTIPESIVYTGSTIWLMLLCFLPLQNNTDILLFYPAHSAAVILDSWCLLIADLSRIALKKDCSTWLELVFWLGPPAQSAGMDSIPTTPLSKVWWTATQVSAGLPFLLRCLDLLCHLSLLPSLLGHGLPWERRVNCQ